MKSPFPGMDPFLERHWEGVHPALCVYIRDELEPQIPADLLGRITMEYRYWQDAEPEPTPKGRMRVDPRYDSSPILLHPIEPIRDRSILIQDEHERTVTAIEVLGPWHKSAGKAVNSYLERRDKYIDSQINLIEIDLIRTGDWTDMIGPYHIPQIARSTYRVTVVKPEAPGLYHYPIHLDSKLPAIKVPLRPQDVPVTIDLQQLIEKAYEMGRYDRIDYTKPCKPPLSAAEQKWADGLIAQRGSRVTSAER